MQLHLEESIQRDVEVIRSKVVEMCGLDEKALRSCVRALREGNRQLAYAVILRDQYVDGMEKELDRLIDKIRDAFELPRLDQFFNMFPGPLLHPVGEDRGAGHAM